jgi:hypothetical protein
LACSPSGLFYKGRNSAQMRVLFLCLTFCLWAYVYSRGKPFNAVSKSLLGWDAVPGFFHSFKFIVMVQFMGLLMSHADFLAWDRH